MGDSNIEWTEKTWNPITGCTPTSKGCDNCYAKRMAETRLRGRCGYPKKEPFKPGTYHPNRMGQPLSWQKPCDIFVCSMGDLFHKEVCPEDIDRVFSIIRRCPQHTFRLLSKRPDRMEAYIRETGAAIARGFAAGPWPLPNVQLGVTAENQPMLGKRIGYLLGTSAAVRFVSLEPLLGPVQLDHVDADSAGHPTMCFINALTGRHDDMGRPCPDVNSLDWVIVGGETGPGARPMHPEWVRSLRDQCVAAGVPFFFKSWGDWKEGSDARRTTKCVYRDGTVVDFDRESLLAEELKSGIPHNKRGGTLMARVGKKAAGNELDGRTWQESPGRVGRDG